MVRMEAIAWVLNVCSALRRSQAKTLADLVAACLMVERVSLAEIGRRVHNTVAKHGIKRVWRFIANRRVQIHEAMEHVIARVVARHRKRALVIALDWVQVRQFHTLSAVAVAPGRGIPLLWASYRKWRLHKSQNNLEEGMLRLLRTKIPASVAVIVLADRGFGRTELARVCQQLGFHYLIRISPDVYVDGRDYRGKLSAYPVRKGICRRLRHLAYRKNDPVYQHVVVHWRRNLPKDRDECWFLMTDLAWSARTLVHLYGQRMTIEQVFRDHKNHRNGFALRHVQVQQADRFDRLLLIVALTYILLVGLGHYARKRYRPSYWSSNTRAGDCSVFTIGRCMLDRIEVLATQIFAALLTAISQPAPKWG